jgi:hypothetical protein
MPTADNVDLFLTDALVPFDEADRDGRRSTLYLLRREAQDCLLTDTVENKLVMEANLLPLDRNKPGDFHRVFGTAMVLFSGTDLLAKFAFGDKSAVGDRFQDFACQYMGLTKPQAHALWSGRNAIMHSFGLFEPPARRSKHKARRGRRLRATLWCDTSRDPHAPPVYRRVDRRWELCIEHMYMAFLTGLAAYEKRLRGGDRFVTAWFPKMFRRYGWMGGGPINP